MKDITAELDEVQAGKLDAHKPQRPPHPDDHLLQGNRLQANLFNTRQSEPAKIDPSKCSHPLLYIVSNGADFNPENRLEYTRPSVYRCGVCNFQMQALPDAKK